MSEPVRFLSAMTQALAQMSLYRAGHPARDRAVDAAFRALAVLQEDDPCPRFTFLGPQAVYGDRPLRELRDWEWGARLSNAGVQRLELERGTSVEEFETFLEEVVARLTVKAAELAGRRGATGTGTIRFGLAGVKGTETETPEAPEAPVIAAKMAARYSLREEAATMTWLQDEVRGQGALPLAEAEAVVRSLSLAMRADGTMVLPIAELAGFDRYGTTHAMNVSVLAMALGEWMELGSKEVRALGTAALLQDLGMTRIPVALQQKTGPLTPEERAVVEGHTAAGAAIIYEADRDLDLAATVAYEHHLTPSGQGYPVLRHPRALHPATALVRVCDVYDALRTVRPHRPAWSAADALAYVEARAGGEFDASTANAFVAMMRSWEARAAALDDVVEEG